MTPETLQPGAGRAIAAAFARLRDSDLDTGEMRDAARESASETAAEARPEAAADSVDADADAPAAEPLPADGHLPI